MDVEETFREHGDDLFRYLARQCGDAELAQDAVQETFLRLHQSPPEKVEAVRAWLFRTGLNVIRDTHRVESNRRRILRSRPSEVPTPGQQPSPAERLESREQVASVRKALAGLREKERTALLMRESGFKHREIADELGTTTATVGTLIARSLAKLESAMQAGGAP